MLKLLLIPFVLVLGGCPMPSNYSTSPPPTSRSWYTPPVRTRTTTHTTTTGLPTGAPVSYTTTSTTHRNPWSW